MLKVAIRQFAKARKKLLAERKKVEAQLHNIDAMLAGNKLRVAYKTGNPGRKKMSAATRRKISLARKQAWAAKKAGK